MNNVRWQLGHRQDIYALAALDILLESSVPWLACRSTWGFLDSFVDVADGDWKPREVGRGFGGVYWATK